MSNKSIINPHLNNNNNKNNIHSLNNIDYEDEQDNKENNNNIYIPKNIINKNYEINIINKNNNISNLYGKFLNIFQLIINEIIN